MNTATTPLRLTAAASLVALAVTLAGCGTPVADESRAHSVSQVVVTPAMHRALVQAVADRYLNDLHVHARMAAESAAAPVDDYPSQLNGR